MTELLTVRKAALALGVTYSTVKRWIHHGSLRTIRTEGGHHRIPVEEVDRLLALQGEPPKPRARSIISGVLVALSGRNQLRGVVDEIRTDGLLAQVRLRIGDQTLTAVITRDAARELKLRRGDEAVAVIKSTEVMVGRAAPAPTNLRLSYGGPPKPRRRRKLRAKAKAGALTAPRSRSRQ